MKQPENEDMRYIRTEKALIAAMLTLLENKRFIQLTVRDICSEAIVSRATFYAHFNDKYDLLLYWLDSVMTEYDGTGDFWKRIEKTSNQLMLRHDKVMKNILGAIDNDLMRLLREYLVNRITMLSAYRKLNSEPQKDALSGFMAGGILYNLIWRPDNKPAYTAHPLDPCFFDLLRHVSQWSPTGNTMQGE